MDPDEQTTGTRDEHYNLISVLYHALHGAENCNTYALDAEAAGDKRLAEFFREAGVMQSPPSGALPDPDLVLPEEDVVASEDMTPDARQAATDRSPPKTRVPPCA